MGPAFWPTSRPVIRLGIAMHLVVFCFLVFTNTSVCTRVYMFVCTNVYVCMCTIVAARRPTDIKAIH